MSEYVWQCPFCGADQPVTDNDRQVAIADLSLPNADGPHRLVARFVVCPNPKCRKFSLTASLYGLTVSGTRSYLGKPVRAWNLVPPSRARSFPVALHPEVLEDYREAWLTLELSPKASAALSRRCISAMLRDYWRVQPGGLNDELRQIKGTADPLTWEAIESVRKSGRMEYKMESEGAEILDTGPGHADLLIPPRNSEIIASRIPGAKLVMVPGGSHGFNFERTGQAGPFIAGAIGPMNKTLSLSLM